MTGENVRKKSLPEAVVSLERDFKDGAEIKKMETLRIRHVITPRFCKLPRKCLLPAGIKLVCFFFVVTPETSVLDCY